MMLRTIAASVLAFLLVCQVTKTQVATARLEGEVRDSTGSVVPGAKVSVINSRTEARLETSATPEGFFIFPSLQPGFYTLRVEAVGFRTTVVSGLELNVGVTVQAPVTLMVGEVTESLTVVANTVRVQNSDAQIARSITLRDIEVLPQLGRGPMSLAIFSTGIQIDPNDPSVSRVNGTRQGSANSKLDGIDVNDSITPRLGLSTTAINSDSVEEFRIVTSGGKAEYGRSPGAQIELITRSGANVWHGNAYEYHRNTALNANNFFNNATIPAIPRPKFIQNTFGGSLSGPLRRDRTFIFGNYQGRRNAQQVSRNRLVLTADAKAGIFRWKSSESSQLLEFDILRNDPRSIGIDPKIDEILKLLPDPNNYDIGDGLNTAGFRFNNPSINTLDDRYDDEFTIKTDHDLRSGHRLFFRWTWSQPSFVDNLAGSDARFPGQPQGTQGGRRWAYSIGSDWTITPRLVNELRVGQMSYSWEQRRPARLSGPMLLANSWTDPLNPNFAQSRAPTMYQISDSFTMVRGKHTLRGGLDLHFTKESRSSDAGIWPNVTFANTDGNVPPYDFGPSGAVTSGSDRQRFENLYNDLLGRMNLVKQTFYSDLEKFQPAGTPRVREHRFREYGYFFQDDWKIHPRFVLNFGLRYEFSGVPLEAHGFQGVVDKAALINHAARLSDLTVQPGGRWYANDFNNLAPRLGFSWDLTGSGRTALRTDWGIFYDRLIGATTSTVDAGTPGFAQSVPVYPNAEVTDVRVSDGIPLPHQPAAPVLRLPAARSTDIVLFTPNLRTGYVQHYSLTLQREIFRNTVVEAGYVGTHGIKLFMNLNLNQPRVYEGFLASFQELQALAGGTPVSPSNILVRLFGSPAMAVSGIGISTIKQGAVGKAADYVDRLKYSGYAGVGLSDFYLRNFPQFNQVIVGTNDGRSYYDSFQLSLRRQTGALKFVANYTFSKSIDNISTEGNGFTSPIDNFNVGLNRARGDYDIPHAFNSSFIYSLPIGKGRWLAAGAPRWVDAALGGWDVGLLTIWQSGRVVTYLSGRATGPSTSSSFLNYAGGRNIGAVVRKGDGVYWLTPEEAGRFSFPASGEIGTGGRNAFRGPRFFDVDLSLVKRFRITERDSVTVRAEAYNLFNNPNFGAPNLDLSIPASFGKISSTVGSPRVLQLALRYDF